jgi:REP element-mobilizing transposase RayT
MGRTAGIAAVGCPHHVTQRGNNRADVFFLAADRKYYLTTLARYLSYLDERGYGVKGSSRNPDRVCGICVVCGLDSGSALIRVHRWFRSVQNR